MAELALTRRQLHAREETKVDAHAAAMKPPRHRDGGGASVDMGVGRIQSATAWDRSSGIVTCPPANWIKRKATSPLTDCV